MHQPNPTIPTTYKAPDHTAATNGTKLHQLSSRDTVKEPTYEFYDRFEVQKFRHLKASVIQAKEEELDEFGVSEQNSDEGGREGRLV